jgi:hypothetical protein
MDPSKFIDTGIDASTAMVIVAAVVGSLAILFQTWLSFQFTSAPPTEGYQRLLARVLVLLSGATAIGAAALSAAHDIQSDKDLMDRFDVRTGEITTTVQRSHEGILIESKKIVDTVCISQRDLMRVLIVMQLRSDYQSETRGNKKAWPPQEYMDKRMREAGITAWTVKVAPDQSSINIEDVRSKGSALDPERFPIQ